MTIRFYVQAQRSNGVAYVDCEPHQATSWVVIREETSRIRGKKTISRKYFGRSVTRTIAQGLADANNKSHEPTPLHLIRKLGRRIVKQGDRG